MFVHHGAVECLDIEKPRQPVAVPPFVARPASNMEMENEMKHSEVMVTPDVAKGWLKMNLRNRPLRQAHVAFLATAMREGKWVRNGDTIRFDDAGLLIDGQHRLAAVVQSGRSVLMDVVKGVDKAAFSTIDTGKKRSASDVLAIDGVKNSARVAAAARLVNWYRNRDKYEVPQNMVFTNRDVSEMVAGEPEIEAAVQLSSSVRLTKDMTAGYSAAFYLIAKVGKQKAVEFNEAVSTGENLSAGDPALTLRNWAMTKIGASKSESRLKAYMWMWATISAWNAWSGGDKLSKIAFGQSVPDIKRYRVK